MASYGGCRQGDVRGLAPRGAYNVHGSLLPRWRGASPIQNEILAGDAVTGITIQRMVRALDAGDILLEGDSPAIGMRYKVVNDFRLVAKGPHENSRGGQTVTLGMVRRGDTVELLDLFVPVPSTETVFVHAKLRAVLDSVWD